ncbi:MAG: transglycosylase SLT domain-containing protein [Acidobacteria bacterium]|nr:transglycosylase SLT domain-containing protein [Acidobacteriota bacterium]
MAKVQPKLREAFLLGGLTLLVSCSAHNAYLARHSNIAGFAASPWLPAPAPAPRAALLSDPPPAIDFTSTSANNPTLPILEKTQPRYPDRRKNESLLKRESDKLLEELRVQELGSWNQAPSRISQQSEPLLLEELLKLNLEGEDSGVPADLSRLLAATRSDLPLALNDRVLRYVNYFLGRGRNTLRASLIRAGKYRPMISKILEEQGLPQELVYLVQAESGFRPKARSPKKATGMWQFVAYRGREYGLNQDRHVDERLDPEKATRAAAHHLADLYRQFGHWHLAMAAYNCGPGGVQRAVERTGYADFWELAGRGVLPQETTNFVPVILAMTLLGKNAEAFHLDDIVPEEPIDYDTVQTNSRIGLPLIADAAGSAVERIKQLNPALLRSSTPAGPYSLRIPKDTAEQFEREIAAVPEIHRQSWRRHQMRENETLTRIAALYKVRPRDIATVNHLGSADPRPGDRLNIPVPLRPEPVQTAAAGVGRRTQAIHKVQPGETLGGVARRYRVTVAQLQVWNHLEGDHLQVGHVLSIRRPHGAQHRAGAGGSPARKGASSARAAATGSGRPRQSIREVASNRAATAAN